MHEPQIVLRNGKPVAVILDIKKYEELLERAEDAADLRTLRAMRKKAASIEEVKRRPRRAAPSCMMFS